MGTKAGYEGGFLRFYDDATLGSGGERTNLFTPVQIYDDFTGVAVDATNDWVKSIVNSSTFAPVANAANGIGRITTGVADDDDHEVSTPLIFLVSNGCGMETRVAVGDVVGSAFNIGFSDAVTEAADLLAFTYATTTLTSTADDAALFFYDPDGTTDVLRAASSKATVDSSITAGVLPVNDVYHTYRVEIDALGNIDWYYDGSLFKRVTAGIATTAVLCAYIGLINRESAANTMDIDYIRAWSLKRS